MHSDHEDTLQRILDEIGNRVRGPVVPSRVLKLVVHVRRSNAVDGRVYGSTVPTHAVAEALHKASRSLRVTAPIGFVIETNLVSQDPDENLAVLFDRVYDKTDPVEAFQLFLDCSYLIVGTSSFSYSAALLRGRRCTGSFPFWHKPLPTWDSFHCDCAVLPPYKNESMWLDLAWFSR